MYRITFFFSRSSSRDWVGAVPFLLPLLLHQHSGSPRQLRWYISIFSNTLPTTARGRGGGRGKLGVLRVRREGVWHYSRTRLSGNWMSGEHHIREIDGSKHSILLFQTLLGINGRINLFLFFPTYLKFQTKFETNECLS